MIITGPAAVEFLRLFHERNRVGNAPEQNQFLEECSTIYRKSKVQTLAARKKPEGAAR